MSVFRGAIFGVFALATMLCAAAHAQDTVRPQIDQTRSVLEDVDQSLKSDVLGDAELQRLRSENDPVGLELRALIAQLTPQLAAAQKRLDELNPKPGADVAEAARADLDAQKQKVDALDGDLRSARALLVQSDDNDARIAGRRRALFARRTFARSGSLLGPPLWIDAASDSPGAFSVSARTIRDWSGRLTLRQILELLGVFAAIGVCAVPVGYAARNVIARDAAASEPSRIHKALAAAATGLVLAVVPLLALGAVSFAMDALDISDPRLQPFSDALFDGLRIVVVANALARAILAPGLPQWRPFTFADDAAVSTMRFWVGASAVVAFEKLLEPIADSVSSLSMIILLRALASGAIAAVLAFMLWRSRGAGRTSAQDDIRSFLRFIGWMMAAAIFAAVLLGYVALANFAVDQALFIAAVATTLYIFDAAIQAAGDAVIARQAAQMRPGRNAGRALAQGVVLAEGALRLATILLAAVVVLAPWGIQSQDLFGALRETYFGIQIGGTVVSLASILSALFVFVVVVFLSRSVQNWLGARLLPQTFLDAGLRNSIRTVFGYIGVIVALALAGSQLGLDFQKVTIVAGALSVGIGFGLQAIVNNFVSGLILLLERAVRVGDWIVVGSEQGFVRKINARATEIETIDRATLIVPNSVLVSTPVKNWMYADRVARIVIAVNVAYDTDVEAARELLIAAAAGQDLVMSIPAPLVLFNEFADWALRFQLICYVDDVMLAERVRSELNFDVLRRFRAAGYRIPYPK